MASVEQQMIQKLLERVNDLEHKVNALKEFISPDKAPIVCGLTPSEALLMYIIRTASPEYVSALRMYAALCDLNNREPQLKVIDALIHKGYKKLKPHGIKLHRAYNVGVRMDLESAAAYDKLLEM